MVNDDQEEDARSKVLEGSKWCRRGVLLEALGCFAAEDYFARLPPNFDNSAMDGYAVAASSCRKANDCV
jgi:molybdopterin biosynthesis enzyme